ncbi:MAG: hypothetical protein ABIR52_14545 [Casimicrobiaceae bacterium]
MGKGKAVYGEGNYEASREYNDATKNFVESGKVEKAAQQAAPASDAEALELAAAEAEGKSRAKEEDPLLTRTAGLKKRAKDGTEGSGGSEADAPDQAPEETQTPKPGEDR